MIPFTYLKINFGFVQDISHEGKFIMAQKKANRKKKSATATEISRSKQKNQSVDIDYKRELSSIFLFAFAVLCLFIVIIKGQSVWEFLHNSFYGIFGVLVFVLPFLIGTVAVFCAMDKFKDSVKVRIIESSLLFVFAEAAIDIFVTSADNTENFAEHFLSAYTSGISLKNGGVLGALIGYPIRLACGKPAAIVLVLIVIFVLLMLLTGTTLIGFFRAMSKPVRSIEKQAGAAFEEIAGRTENGSRKRAFNMDISVDHIPEERKQPEISLNERERKLVESYNFGEEDDEHNQVEINDEKIGSAKVKIKKRFGKKNITSSTFDDATEISADESVLNTVVAAENGDEKISVKKETEEFTKEVMDGEEYEDAYSYPSLSLLNENKNKLGTSGERELKATAENLVNVLKSFGVETRIVDVSRGPAVTRYELQPSVGVKISKITGLADDIALNLATAGVRIEAPIPNKAAVGIEVPNKSTAMVGVKEILETNAFNNAKSKLTVALGKDIGGNAVMTDIAKMPHGLIAGSTGSGKSVCINSIIISLLYKASPDEVKLLMIDPKVVELGIYNGIPHLLVPVVTDPRKASGALGWAVTEMEKRYKLFAENDVRNLEGYNHLAEMSDDMTKMPHIVIIIDELADLMMTAPKEVEDSICRIAQKARAAGMHLIIATQRPSVDVVTGLIKANVPTRIAFAVSSQIDSRTILDMGGAEKLLGKGDMLFCPVGSNKPTRIQGCFVSDEEVERVVEFVKNGKSAEYDKSVSDTIESMAAANNKDKGGKSDSNSDGDRDPMIEKAVECIIDAGQASTSLLQRRLKLGYARAARIIDELEVMGIVGPYEGAKPRQVLISRAQWMERQALSNDTSVASEETDE